MVLPQFAHYSDCRIDVLNFGLIPVAISGALFLQFEGGVVGWLAGGREGIPGLSLFPGWSLKTTLCNVHGCHNYK